MKRLSGVPEEQQRVVTAAHISEEQITVHLGSLRKAAYLTASVGILHASLFLIAILMLAQAPGVNASDEALTSFYSSSGERRWLLFAGLYLMPFAGIAFIWYIVALRAWSRGYIRRENVLLSNVQFVSGIIYTSLFFAAAASSSVTAASAEFSSHIDPEVARQFPQFGSALLLVFAMRMAAMFVLSTLNIMRPTRLLPKWFVIASYLVALFLLLSATLNPWWVLVLPIWIVVYCLLVIERARRIPRSGTVIEIEAAGIVILSEQA